MADVQIVVRVKDQFTQALQKAGTSVQQFGQQAQSAAAKVRGAFGGLKTAIGNNKVAFAALGAAAFAAAKQFADLFLSQVRAADALEETSQKLGIAVSDLSALQYSAKLAGVESEALTGSLKIFSRNMADAANGTGGAVQAFKALGVESKNADGTLKSQTQLMGEIADKFAETADGAGKTAIAMDIFGRSGADMIPLLNGGSAALAEQRAKAESLGIVLDDVGAKRAAAFADAMDNLKYSTQGAMQEFVKGAAPAFKEAMDSMTTALADATNSGALENWAKGFGKAVNFIVGAIRILWNWFQIVGESIGSIVGMMAAAVINGFTGMLDTISAFGSVLKSLFTGDFTGAAEAATNLKNTMKNSAGLLIDTFKVGFTQIGEDAAANFADMGNAADLMFSSEENGQKQLTETTKQESKKRLDYQVIDESAAAKAAKDAQEERIKAMNEAAKAAEEHRKQIVEGQKMLSEAKIAGLQQEIAAEGITFAQQQALTAERSALELEALRAERDQKLIDLQANEEAQLLVKQAYILKEQQLKADALAADEAISAARRKLAMDETKNALGNLAKATEGSKKFFAMNKAFSIANATISGYESAVSSFAAGSKIGGPVLGAVFAAASVAATGKMISDIASQKFAKGGFPRGRNALATLNDDPRGGQEAVLNAGAVRSLGFGQINALNAGRGMQGGRQVAINLGGVVVQGGDPAQVQAAVESGIDRAAQRLQKMLRYNSDNNVPEAVFA